MLSHLDNDLVAVRAEVHVRSSTKSRRRTHSLDKRFAARIRRNGQPLYAKKGWLTLHFCACVHVCREKVGTGLLWVLTVIFWSLPSGGRRLVEGGASSTRFYIALTNQGGDHELISGWPNQGRRERWRSSWLRTVMLPEKKERRRTTTWVMQHLTWFLSTPASIICFSHCVVLLDTDSYLCRRACVSPVLFELLPLPFLCFKFWVEPVNLICCENAFRTAGTIEC